MVEKWDVVIIGAGLAGYVAANHLIGSGLSVLIVEKGSHIGGRARSDTVDGNIFNLGPHALYKKGNAMSILESIEVKLKGNSPKLSGFLIDNNEIYTAPLSPYSVMTTKYLNWKERLEWISVTNTISTIDTKKLTSVPFQEWVEQIAKSTKVQQLLYMLSRLSSYSHAPECSSAKVILNHMKLGMGGVIYIDHGWQEIIDQLHHRAVNSGMTIRTNKHVKEFQPSESGSYKILSTEEEIVAQHIIFSGSPKDLQSIANISISTMEPMKGATLDVSLSVLPNPSRLFAIGISESIYYSVHSKYAKLSMNDNHVLHMFKYHHPNDSNQKITRKEELENWLERLQPGWKTHETSSRFIPNITVNQRLPIVGDFIEVMKIEKENPGLYLAGDWADSDFILSEAAVRSGKRAAESILGKERRGDPIAVKSERLYKI